MPDLLSLLTWSTRPDIAAWLTYFRTTKDHARRELALTKLESLVKTSDSPVEQRRAATTLLRALDHKWPASVNPDRKEGARNQSRHSPTLHASAPPPSPRSKRGEVSGGSATDGEVGCSPSPQPPSPSAPPIQNPKSAIQNLPPLPAPSITPALSHTPTTIARALVQDLQLSDPTQAFITLRSISTEAANEEDLDPLLARIETHLNLPDSAIISDPEYPGTPPPYENAARIRILHPTRPPIILEFLKLPHQPWLLDLFDTG